MIKKNLIRLFVGIISAGVLLPGVLFPSLVAFAENSSDQVSFLEAVIVSEDTVAVKRSTILDASQSFIPNQDSEYTYEWDFGDGNKNEGVEVLHAYKNPGKYTISLRVYNDEEESVVQKEIYVFKKLILLLTDSSEDQLQIERIKSYAEEQGVYLKILDSFGSASEFISEEILTKKLIESTSYIQKALQIIVWTRENSGMNAFSRFVQETKETSKTNFSQKSIVVITDDISEYSNRTKRQFAIISPKNLILAQEAGIYQLIDNFTSGDFIESLKTKGYEYELITEGSLKLRPWNFMSYFLSILIDKGIPDNTIALLLLLPIIATVVAAMKQIVGLTTMGIYTPTIITLSFLIIGPYFGLLTLLMVLTVGALTRHLMRKVRLLFIPKMAIVLTVVAITLFLALILSIYLDIFNATFFSLAIFPMVILSTLVEKFISIKTEKGWGSAVVLMSETIAVSLIAFFVAGGGINLGFTIIQWDFFRNLMLNYPEFIFVLLVINILLGRWSGLRLLEFIRFREVLRHIEE
ncbi:MAG: 7TM domain-containing protein [Candidatus Gracilibacteria bacterium]